MAVNKKEGGGSIISKFISNSIAVKWLKPMFPVFILEHTLKMSWEFVKGKKRKNGKEEEQQFTLQIVACKMFDKYKVRPLGWHWVGCQVQMSLPSIYLGQHTQSKQAQISLIHLEQDQENIIGWIPPFF